MMAKLARIGLHAAVITGLAVAAAGIYRLVEEVAALDPGTYGAQRAAAEGACLIAAMAWMVAAGAYVGGLCLPRRGK